MEWSFLSNSSLQDAVGRSPLAKRRGGGPNGLVLHGAPGALLGDALLNAYGNAQLPKKQVLNAYGNAQLPTRLNGVPRCQKNLTSYYIHRLSTHTFPEQHCICSALVGVLARFPSPYLLLCLSLTFR